MAINIQLIKNYLHSNGISYLEWLDFDREEKSNKKNRGEKKCEIERNKQVNDLLKT